MALGAAVLMVAGSASASNVEADDPVPASQPSVWWDPLGLFRGEPNPVVRRSGEGQASGKGTLESGNPVSRPSTYHEGRGPGIPVDYSYDHIVDQQ
jgi:hypothetical protein